MNIQHLPTLTLEAGLPGVEGDPVTSVIEQIIFIVIDQI